MSARPYVLSIAGFDPSSGAGITADLKTFEQHKVYGMGVCSAITYQTEDEFLGVEWISPESIFKQLEVLFSKYQIGFAKVGLIQNLDVLSCIVDWLDERECKVIWDPILKASAGYTIHTTIDSELLYSIMSRIFLITPNIPEFTFIKSIIESEDVSDMMRRTQLQALLLKGGHSVGQECCDVLYADSKEELLKAPRIDGFAKHGTGCVLSSAIVSQLALGLLLPEACKKAKQYVEGFILSNQTLLGYHL
jgi:hydroxymethylpyrimidine kinase/phosphomethylpyrimidine kinase